MIRFERVTVQYGRSGLALNDVSFFIRKGEFCFLTGHSGAGKTTALRLMHMAVRPTTGEVTVGAYSSSQIKPREVALLRRKVGFVFQDFRLLEDRTAAENVAFALEVTGAHQSVVRTKVGRLLAQVGLAHRSEAYPSELSGGERQRVAIARALANDPLVLLADEPTGNLDDEAKRGVFDLFRDINTLGTAVVMATHDHELVRAVPDAHIIELNQGFLVRDTAPEI
ncbi:MAG TPA: cell division ATP-binding protein FtsE [Longimicrobiales bacterium]|nr:cell division ATP-binding protein FtsE [Longimicrobiales bacterium]